MNFDLTDEQKMIREMARDFAREVIAPCAEDMERTGEYPYDIIEQMADLGIMGIPFPEEYGGSGGDWVGTHICIEEISRSDVGLGASGRHHERGGPGTARVRDGGATEEMARADRTGRRDRRLWLDLAGCGV